MSLAGSIRSSTRLLIVGVGVWVGAGGAPASAANTNLTGTVSTNTAGTLVQQSFVDVRSATLTGVSTSDAVGNASTSDGQLLAPSGIFTLTAGARSGGGAGTGGQANAQAHCDANQVYVITSATLPPGTLVPVTIGWALSGHAGAAGNLTHYLSGATGEVDGRVQVDVNGATVMNKSGVYRRAYDTTNGGYNFVSGTLNMLGDFGVVSANVPVGQTVRLYLDMTVTAVTTAVLQSTTGGDAEAVMLWGVSVTGGDAAAVLQSDPNEAAPSAANANPTQAALALPSRPAGSLNCLEFSSQPESLTRCVSGEASFSVAATGNGPFTYQWSRNGVAISSALNPSAATPTLSLTSVQPSDGGSYDCIVANACGSVASDAATLTVDSPPAISQQPAPASSCTSGSATLSVAATGTALSYQWQIESLPPGSEAWSDLSDGPLLRNAQQIAIVQNSHTAALGYTLVLPDGLPIRSRCRVTTACGSLTSNAATYSVCYGNCDCSTAAPVLNVGDFTCFLQKYAAQDPYANCDGSTAAPVLNVGDFTCFLQKYAAGCP